MMGASRILLVLTITSLAQSSKGKTFLPNSQREPVHNVKVSALESSAKNPAAYRYTSAEADKIFDKIREYETEDENLRSLNKRSIIDWDRRANDELRLQKKPVDIIISQLPTSYRVKSANALKKSKSKWHKLLKKRPKRNIPDSASAESTLELELQHAKARRRNKRHRANKLKEESDFPVSAEAVKAEQIEPSAMLTPKFVADKHVLRHRFIETNIHPIAGKSTSFNETTSGTENTTLAPPNVTTTTTGLNTSNENHDLVQVEVLNHNQDLSENPPEVTQENVTSLDNLTREVRVLQVELLGINKTDQPAGGSQPNPNIDTLDNHNHGPKITRTSIQVEVLEAKKKLPSMNSTPSGIEHRDGVVGRKILPFDSPISQRVVSANGTEIIEDPNSGMSPMVTEDLIKAESALPLVCGGGLSNPNSKELSSPVGVEIPDFPSAARVQAETAAKRPRKLGRRAKRLRQVLKNSRVEVPEEVQVESFFK